MKDPAQISKSETNLECQWFDRLVRSGADMNDADSARFVRHLESCAAHQTQFKSARSMIEPILKAAGQRVVGAFDSAIRANDGDPRQAALQSAFRELMRLLRQRRALTNEQLAQELDVSVEEVRLLEEGGRPSPRTFHKLSTFYGIPQRNLARLAGVIRDVPDTLEAEASRFAAQSRPFSLLTREERRLLDEFVKFLKVQT